MAKRRCSVEGCNRPHEARSWCHGHYARWKNHRDVFAHIPLLNRFDPVERFWAKVLKTNSCWLWTACLGKGGHGLFRNGQTGLAHRFSYELHYGPIPEGVSVLHACGNAACVNPKHLYLGNQLQNMRDRDEHGTTARGERAGRAVLTLTAANEIRRRYDAGDVSFRELATEYGVGHTTIRSVIRGFTYVD